jgi:tetratricopeptide (TPR) repeat protein
MDERSNTKNRRGSSSSRAGSARLVGVLLGIGALLAASVAGYALWTLTQSPTSQAAADTGNADDPENQGIAETESIEEILGAVQIYVRNQQYPQATTVLEHAVGQYPSDQELRFALGDLYMFQKQYADAYAQFVAGIEIGPGSATGEFTAGTLANMLDRTELAEAHYSASMRLDPTNPDTPMYLAAIEMKLNRLDDAKRNLALAGRLAPERARIFAMRSEIAMRENHAVIALEQIRKARAIEPRVLGWILQEARVLKRNGDAEGAISLLVSLPEEQLTEPEIAYLLAESYGMLGRPGDAASRLMDVATVHPEDAKLAFEVALWLERAGERASAIEWAQKAEGLGNTRARAWIESLP